MSRAFTIHSGQIAQPETQMKPALFVFCVLPMTAFAQVVPETQTSDAIAEFETGVICAPETTSVVTAPDTVAGFTNVIVEDPPFVSNKHRVPAVMGVGFGIKSRARNSDGLTGVVMTVTHPPMGEARTTVQRYTTTIRGNDTSLTFYQFDYDYELLPGQWQMQASLGDEILYTTTFQVLPAEQVPELAAICGFSAMLS